MGLTILGFVFDPNMGFWAVNGETKGQDGEEVPRLKEKRERVRGIPCSLTQAH